MSIISVNTCTACEDVFVVNATLQLSERLHVSKMPIRGTSPTFLHGTSKT